MTRTLLSSHETTTRERRSGRDEEVADFVAAHEAALLRTAYLLTGDKTAAAELVRDALGRLYLSWDSVRAGEGAESFLRRRMFTAHASPWRLHQRRTGRAPADSALWQRIQALPPRQRAVVVLCHHEGLTEAEAADVLGIREHAARTLLLRARTALGVATAA